MSLSTIDWIIICVYLLISALIGVRFAKQSGKGLDQFFLGGRKLPWYLAGVSMVATTFAADTPLAVTELVAKSGVAGNWLWWNMLIGGMLTTFFFAKLWRRSGVLTELEFIEFRYSGTVAKFLRGFKAVYLGVGMNIMILGWVNLAMLTVVKVLFGIDEHQALWLVGGIMLIATIYSSLGGLKGVVVTDAIQFVIAMAGCIILSVIVVRSDQIGGIDGLKNALPQGSLNFLPRIGETLNSGHTLGLGIGAFLAFATMQWWASWYPGAEPGGGGYVAQRMMSAKDERSALKATLLFQIGHYCIRPWPWIIVALCATVLYPHLENPGEGFVLVIRDFLPGGLRGLLFTAFLAAYMSTVSTQLNWGASFLVNDLYKRFIRPVSKFSSEEKANQNYVKISRALTVLIALASLAATLKMNAVSDVWTFIIECGAGLGGVLILRWYWWRINAWSELVAMLVPFLTYYLASSWWGFEFPDRFFVTVSITTACWIIVTLITPGTEQQHLQRFYDRVQPLGWWKPFGNGTTSKNIMPLVVSWLSAVLMTYATLFTLGKAIFGEWRLALWCGATALVFGYLLSWGMRKSNNLSTSHSS